MSNLLADRRLAIWRKWTDGPLLLLAVGSIPLLLLETISDRLPQQDRTFLLVVNIIVFVAFFVDYVIELLVTESKAKYVKTQWGSLLIVVAQFLALLPAFGFLGVLRVVRALRPIIGLFRVLGLAITAKQTGRDFLKRRAASLAFGIAGLTVITSSVAFTLAEDVGQGRRIESFFDALWWSIATITTVGYGDIFPTTGVGRVVAAFTMIVGIGTLSTVTARIAAFLLRD